MLKLKKLYKFTIIISIIVLIFAFLKTYYFKSEDKKENGKEQSTEGEKEEEKYIQLNYKDYITSTSESNSEVIEEYIADKMSLDNFKKSLENKNNYIENDSKYKPVTYNFEKHYKYRELENIYKSLNASKIVKLEVIGKSVDNRDIYSIEIGKGKDKILIEGNIHAAEIAPTLFLTKLATELVNGWESGVDEIEELLENHTIVMIPSINPDGYDYSIFGKSILNNKDNFVYENDSSIDQDFYKANINGVDLNRNMPSELSGLYVNTRALHYTVVDSPSTANYEYYPGENVGSEPETQALIYWMLKHYKDAHAYLSLHSAGRVIYNGKPYLSDRFNKLSNECAKVVNSKTHYTILGIEDEIDGDGTDGTSTDLIAELVHGYKFSTVTGRLSKNAYLEKTENLERDMCVLTIETLTNYTQNLATISNEYTSNNIKEAIIAITNYKFD